MPQIYYLYWIFKPLIYVTWKTAYKIRFIGKKNIDFSKPTLIISNHTNSVIDPVAIAINLRKGIYFLARGDAFANNFFDWLLSQFHLVPIYRKEEFADNQQKNEAVFERIFELFDNNKPVIIFSEGKCVQQKTLRPFKKGTAHIAVEYALRNNDWNRLQILPIGLNYHIYNRFNDDLIQYIGEPFTLQDIGITEINDLPAVIEHITRTAEQRLEKTLILMPREELQGMEIPVEIMVRKDLLKQDRFKDRKQHLFDMRQAISNKLTEEYASDKAALLHFKQQLNQLEELLKPYNIQLTQFNRPSLFWNYLCTAGLLLTVPFFVLGCVFNAIPFLLPKIIAEKKVKNPVFKNTVRVVVAMVLFFIFYTLYFLFIPYWLGISGLLLRTLSGFLVLVIAYSALMFSYYWYRVFKIVKGSIRFSRLPPDKRKQIEWAYERVNIWLQQHFL